MRLLDVPAFTRTRAIAALAFAVLLAAFAIDALTPQTLVFAVGYYIPIALAALTVSRRLTRRLLVAALLLNVPAAILDAAHDGFRWDVIGLEDRILAMVSITLVGMLSLAVQVRAENQRLVKELAARNRDLGDRQQVISELVDTIAHDIRTPLSALSVTMAQAAGGAYGSLPAGYASVLRDSRVSIDDLNRLAETLLLVARCEETGLEVRREPVALATTVRELLSEFGASAQARGVTLSGAPAEEATVLASAGDLRRAIANLLANALSYTPRGGQVDVNVRRRDGLAEVVVSDDGFGVDPELRAQLFERESRGSGAGTGLGLYIVRRVAETAGGFVRYDPKERGSIFTLSLPEARERCGQS